MANLDAVYEVDNRSAAFENHESGLLVSIAGPGTGKTYSFLRRIESLTGARGVQPNSVCYLTFIKEIARAFVKDYEEEFGIEADELKRPRTSTLHSFACRLIRNRGFSVGYDGPLYFASIEDRNSEVSNVFLSDLFPHAQIGDVRTVPRLRRVIATIKECWRDIADPEGLAYPVPNILPISLKLARSYRLIDWDQAIPLAHSLFKNPDNRQRWIMELHHFLVDEYQDFNRAEQAFILTLSKTVDSMVVVGDDDQSIFRGRGGSPIGLRELFEAPGVDRVTLTRCRRCKSNILSAANTFLSSMCSAPHIMLPHEDGGTICCYSFKSSKAEIIFLSDFLQNCINQLPDQPSAKDGIVCLFPSWKVLTFYLSKLQNNIPCYTRKVEIPEQRHLLFRYLELVCNPHQRFIERLILESYRDIKARHKKSMVELIISNDTSPVNAIGIILAEGLLTGSAADAAHSFVELCNALSSQDPSNITDHLSEIISADPAEIQDALEEFISKLGETDQEDLINSFCDRVLTESAPPAEDPRSVLFLTIHGSKGLTRKTVILPGLEDSWLPGDADGEDLEERKRLFYVALTRATDLVLISCPRTRARGDPLNFPAPGRGEPSRFIDESKINCFFSK
jgi:DNA helicase-2/ATP-dependent DNA helicase PcrA